MNVCSGRKSKKVLITSSSIRPSYKSSKPTKDLEFQGELTIMEQQNWFKFIQSKYHIF